MNRRTFLTQAGIGSGILLSTAISQADDKVVFEYLASDVEYIAEWMQGKDPDGAFGHKAGLITEFIVDGTIAYSDVAGVKWSKVFRPVPYDFIQTRIKAKADDKNKKLSSIVVITGSILENPPEWGKREDFKAMEKGDRCYYYEVHSDTGISTWGKVVIRGVKGKLKVKEYGENTT
jgi:hypothetical protein